MPGHHIQIDVKFLSFIDERGEKICRFEYPAIDDATRVRALKIYEKHTEPTSIVQEHRPEMNFEFDASLKVPSHAYPDLVQSRFTANG